MTAFFKRTITNQVISALGKEKKVVIIYGPRQAGKRTLARQITLENGWNTLSFSGDDPDVPPLLNNMPITRLQTILQNKELLFIDEGQKIPNLAKILKSLTDCFHIKILVTASCSFDFKNQINENLADRKLDFTLLPLTFQELNRPQERQTEEKQFYEYLVYGSYPEIISAPKNKDLLLTSLTDNFLLKDILLLDGLRKNDCFHKLLTALSWQIDSELNYTALAGLIGLSKDTVSHYLNILQQAYIIFTLPSFAKNGRNELKKAQKVYFYDNGIRNALIHDFSPFRRRDQQEQKKLLKNYLISERIKFLRHNLVPQNSYFWRNTQLAEVDYLEETGNLLYAYEFKLNDSKKAVIARAFTNLYPETACRIITPETRAEFLTGK